MASTLEEGIDIVRAVSTAYLSAAENRLVRVDEAEQFDEVVFNYLLKHMKS